MLTLLLGPLGLFYSNVVAAIAVLLGAFLFGVAGGGFVAGFMAWMISMLLSFAMVDSHNTKIEIEERRHREMLAAVGGKGLENSEVNSHQPQAPDGGSPPEGAAVDAPNPQAPDSDRNLEDTGADHRNEKSHQQSEPPLDWVKNN